MSATTPTPLLEARGQRHELSSRVVHRHGLGQGLVRPTLSPISILERVLKIACRNINELWQPKNLVNENLRQSRNAQCLSS
jgi:hypothetical protein